VTRRESGVFASRQAAPGSLIVLAATVPRTLQRVVRGVLEAHAVDRRLKMKERRCKPKDCCGRSVFFTDALICKLIYHCVLFRARLLPCCKNRSSISV
jgi:hypothetical protein